MPEAPCENCRPFNEWRTKCIYACHTLEAWYASEDERKRKNQEERIERLEKEVKRLKDEE